MPIQFADALEWVIQWFYPDHGVSENYVRYIEEVEGCLYFEELLHCIMVFTKFILSIVLIDAVASFKLDPHLEKVEQRENYKMDYQSFAPSSKLVAVFRLH